MCGAHRYPRYVATNKLAALLVSAQKPSIGLNFVIFAHSFYDFPAPKSVPNAITILAQIATQKGTSNTVIMPAENKKTVMIPIVFEHRYHHAPTIKRC
jgi:hypothetical protein